MNRTPPLWLNFVVHGGLVLFTMLTLYPVLWVLRMALSPGQSFSMSANPIPTEVDFGNFEAVIMTFDGNTWLFGRQLFNSLVVSSATALVGVVLAATAAYALSRWNFPGRDRGMAAFLVTQMFPGVVMAIPLYILLDTAGLLDTLMGLVLVYATTAVPFSVFTLKGYFDTLPVALEEAAIMDGCDRWTAFVTIVLPLARPALAVTALFSFMTAWNEFILAATLLGDPTSFTLPVVLQRYVDDHGTAWGSFAAGAILVSLPVVGLFFALQKQLVEGLTAGAVKG
ncbi:MAG: sugar ABC transporter permease [Myxococcota bacterium]